MKKALCTTVAILVVFFSPVGIDEAQGSGIPTVDVANLAESIRANLQRGIQWGKEMALKSAHMDMDSILAKMGIQNSNNNMANNIVRRGQAMQDVQNLEVAEKSAPDDDACRTMVVGNIVGQVDKANKDSLNRMSEEESMRQVLGRRTKGSHQTDQELQRNVGAQLFDECIALQKGDAPENEQQALYTSMCADSGMLMGVGTGDVYTADQQRAVDRIVRLIAGPVPASLQAAGQTEGDTTEAVRKRLYDLRLQTLRKVVYDSLNSVAAVRRNYSDISEMASLQKFIDDRFSDADWIAKVGNVHPDEKNNVMPSEVQRKMAAMMAFQVSLDLKKYRQSLRMEALAATSLALDVTPLGSEVR